MVANGTVENITLDNLQTEDKKVNMHLQQLINFFKLQRLKVLFTLQKSPLDLRRMYFEQEHFSLKS